MISRAALLRAEDLHEKRVVAGGLRAVRGIVDRARRAALRAYTSGSPSWASHAARAELGALTPVVADAMTIGHLEGRQRVVHEYAAAPRRGVRLANPYEGALDFLRRRLAMTPQQVADVTRRYGPAAARATADTSEAVEKGIQKAVDDIIGRGLHVRQGVEELGKAFEALGIAGAKEYQLETLFRTQHQMAYGAGRWQANQDPVVQEILWGYEYVTVRDDRVRPTHQAIDGHRAMKDDPFWLTNWPPNGWNCRCSTLSIFRGDEEAVASNPLPPVVEIDGEAVRPGADPGWGFNPGRIVEQDLWSHAPPTRIARVLESLS